ncbi:dTMP kinase [Allopusillimonas soli]|uniref:Thymidylate kinase n=1 Tax=Allopusillimonas soli TaxID=659016 RepID=A0A853FAA2_9BURK|nr:dTMP kinase [Allopusillimonas soli]NYT36708.1 dTMP kinase [Allopusillimonas soli]TEA75185.1 dTMP kinase [Allopusillimonas soli]
MEPQRGCFITLEGLDGAGKSTHVQWLVEHLRASGRQVLSTREPGGTALGEQLRDILLHTPMEVHTETLLMFAARSEHTRTVILPALRQGIWVVCDRYTDASYAYQGGGRGLGAAAIQQLELWALEGLAPDRSWLFDVPLDVARQRLSAAREPDRFERQGAAFFERTRQAYLVRAAEQPERLRIIDSTQTIDDIRGQLASELNALIAAWTGQHASTP